MAERHSENFVLIGSPKTLKKGDQFRSKNWPQSITVIPSFEVPQQEQRLHSIIQSHVQNWHHIELLVDDDLAYFGTHEDTPGYRVYSDDLMTIQSDILDDFQIMGIDIKSSAIGQDYAPYIKAESGLQVPSTIILNALQLVVKKRSRASHFIKIEGIYPFGVLADEN